MALAQFSDSCGGEAGAVQQILVLRIFIQFQTRHAQLFGQLLFGEGRLASFEPNVFGELVRYTLVVGVLPSLWAHAWEVEHPGCACGQGTMKNRGRLTCRIKGHAIKL